MSIDIFHLFFIFCKNRVTLPKSITANMNIADFIDNIAYIEPADERSVNLYRGNDILSTLIRQNLEKYLYEMSKTNPEILLIGEAPGIHGCYKTGIAFTDEYTISTNEFFANKGYCIMQEKASPEKEQSATTIWEIIGSSDRKPLLWNIYPFYPYDKGQVNRTPSKAEIELGYLILQNLLTAFNIKRIYGLGRAASNRLNVDYIRHPSHGGKTACQERLRKILGIIE